MPQQLISFPVAGRESLQLITVGKRHDITQARDARATTINIDTFGF